MENDEKKRVGRPKARPQTGPLVLEGSRVRTKVELELGAETAEELRAYVSWVELSSTFATSDATFATVDYALREMFKRDRLWQERRRNGSELTPGSASKAATAAPSLPPSLPPPASAPRPVPASAGR